jgi:hypothetical protein
MSDQIQLKEKEETSLSPAYQAVGAPLAVEASRKQKKGCFKGILPMGICCTAPLLLALAIPIFGFSLAGVAGALLPVVAILACPLSMYFMMRTMNKK